MVERKEYKYTSPVLDSTVRNRKTGAPQGWTLTSLALTNKPVLGGMPAIAFSEAGWSMTEEKTKVKKLVLADRAARTVRVIEDDGTENVLVVEGLEAPATAPKVLRLSEVRRTSEGVLDFGSVQVEEGVLVAGEVLRAMAGQAELDAAVDKGLITPAQRPHYEAMAFGNLSSFRELVKTMKPVVDQTEHGLGGGAGEGTELDKLEAQLDQLTRAKIAANNGMQYHTALKLVASERPDLDRRRTQLMRERKG